MPSRRSFLGYLTVAGGALATPFLAKTAQAAVTAKPMSIGLPDKPVLTTYIDHVPRWVSEIRKYEQAWLKAGHDFVERSISVPFGTFPLHFYMRIPEEVGYTPDIADLRLYIEKADRWSMHTLRAVIRELLPEMLNVGTEVRELKKPSSAEIARAEKLGPVAMPDRIITPSYEVDIALLRNDTLANLILRACHGIANETWSRVDTALAYFRAAYPEQVPCISHWRAPADCEIKRDGPMLNIYCWIDSAGICHKTGVQPQLIA